MIGSMHLKQNLICSNTHDYFAVREFLLLIDKFIHYTVNSFDAVIMSIIKARVIKLKIECCATLVTLSFEDSYFIPLIFSEKQAKG